MELGEDGEQEIGTAEAAKADTVSQAGDLPTGEGGDVSIYVHIKPNEKQESKTRNSFLPS